MAETTKPLTVDNLGIDSYSRYARDKEALVGSKLIEESRLIPQKTEVSVVRPYKPTEFDEYLRPQQLQSYASFPELPEEGSGTPFSYELIPSLGGYEKREEGEESVLRLESIIKSQMKEGQVEEKERNVLLNFFKTFETLERDHSYIISRRNQYHKG